MHKTVQNYEHEYCIEQRVCTIPHCSQQYCWSTAAGRHVTPTAVLHRLASSSTCNVCMYVSHCTGRSVQQLQHHICALSACCYTTRIMQKCKKCVLQQFSDIILFTPNICVATCKQRKHAIPHFYPNSLTFTTNYCLNRYKYKESIMSSVWILSVQTGICWDFQSYEHKHLCLLSSQNISIC